jgi:hypothetical protein
MVDDAAHFQSTVLSMSLHFLIDAALAYSMYDISSSECIDAFSVEKI